MKHIVFRLVPHGAPGVGLDENGTTDLDGPFDLVAVGRDEAADGSITEVELDREGHPSFKEAQDRLFKVIQAHAAVQVPIVVRPGDGQ